MFLQFCVSKWKPLFSLTLDLFDNRLIYLTDLHVKEMQRIFMGSIFVFKKRIISLYR